MGFEGMKYDVLVLGAGMVGVSCALHLQAKGKSVALFDRQEAGQETSFGNAGIIQREAVRPYSFPRALSVIGTAATNRRLDVRYHASALPRVAGPLLRYFNHSAPSAYEKIAADYASMIAMSIDTHADLIKAAQAESLVEKQGWLMLMRSQKNLEAAFAEADTLQREHGVNHRKLNQQQLAELEPGIAKGQLVGAVHWTDPWTLHSPGDLVKAYAELFNRRGGKMLFGDALTLEKTAAGWQVRTRDGETVTAAEVVIALGPWTTKLTERFGFAPPMFVKRGYHMHYAALPDRKLNHWVLDEERGYLIAPMKNGLRLTTGAELALIDSPSTPKQLIDCEAVARDLLPIGDRVDPEPWKGARPCMPDMKPVIGAVPDVPGMWCAFGHGHQGFTLGPATGELLAALMTGEKPQIDMQPFSAGRRF